MCPVPNTYLGADHRLIKSIIVAFCYFSASAFVVSGTHFTCPSSTELTVHLDRPSWLFCLSINKLIHLFTSHIASEDIFSIFFVMFDTNIERSHSTHKVSCNLRSNVCLSSHQVLNSGQEVFFSNERRLWSRLALRS